MRHRVPDTHGGKHLLGERTSSPRARAGRVNRAFPGPSSRERKGLAFPISGETMGEDNSWFWLPFQLLLVDEVKIGSRHLKAPPLCRRKPACLSLWAPSRRLLCVWEPQDSRKPGWWGEWWPCLGRLWKVVSPPDKMRSCGQRGRCHRTEGGLVGRLIQSLPTGSSPRPPFTLE